MTKPRRKPAEPRRQPTRAGADAVAAGIAQQRLAEPRLDTRRAKGVPSRWYPLRRQVWSGEPTGTSCTASRGEG